MNDSRELFIHALLADASYADFSTNDTFQNQLKPRLGENLKELLQDHWKLVSSDAHCPNTAEGFSATLFESKDDPGRKVLAFRGTEASPNLDRGDIDADVNDIALDGVAFHQIVDLYNFVQRLRSPAGAHHSEAKLVEVSMPANSGMSLNDWVAANGYIIDKGLTQNKILKIELNSSIAADGLGLISSGDHLSVTGHSLGGHLAMAFSRIFPEFGAETYSINGAGFDLSNSNLERFFNALTNGSQFRDASVTNIFNDVGPEIVTQNSASLTQIGLRVPIYAETWNPQSAAGHGANIVTDAMAVYDMFIRLDRNLANMSPLSAVSVLTPILKAGGNENLIDLEGTVGALGRTLISASFANPAKDDRG